MPSNCGKSTEPRPSWTSTPRPKAKSRTPSRARKWLTREAIASLGDKPRQVEVRLHPEDLEAIEALLVNSAGVRLHADPALARGDLRVHAEDVRLDARLGTRLEQILPRLLSESSGEGEDAST